MAKVYQIVLGTVNGALDGVRSEIESGMKHAKQEFSSRLKAFGKTIKQHHKEVAAFDLQRSEFNRCSNHLDDLALRPK